MKTKSYIFLGVFLLLNIILIPLFMPNGGISTDSLSYFHLANELPNPSWSLFPLGYPAFLRFFNFIFKDYFWSSKYLNIAVFITIFLFSYFKKYYFKETVILLSTKIFVYLFYYSLSEPLFLGCLYFLFYYIEGYLSGRLKSHRFFLPAALMMSVCFTVRYSGIYIAVSLAVFYPLYLFKNNRIKSFFQDDFFYFLLLGTFGILCYMSYNYFQFGDFSGEKFRSDPYVSIGRNILGLFNSFNPILGIKLNSSSNLALISGFFLLCIDLFFIYWFVKIWKKEFRTQFAWFHFLLIFTGILYSAFLFLTCFYQGIEELNIRMICESSFCYFFSVIILYFKQKRNEKLIYIMAIFTLVFTAVYYTKDPVNFLKRKENIEARFSEMNGKKYYYNNASDKETIYEIPIINKKIRYNHPDAQLWRVNRNIIMTKDPKILWIKENDTARNKKEVIYATDLE